MQTKLTGREKFVTIEAEEDLIAWYCAQSREMGYKGYKKLAVEVLAAYRQERERLQPKPPYQL